MGRISDFIDVIHDMSRALLAPAYLMGGRMLMNQFLALAK